MRIKKLWGLALWVALTAACNAQEGNAGISIDSLFERKYQHKLISSGDNFPDFRVRKARQDVLLVALHMGMPLEEFQSKMGFSKVKADSIIKALETSSWVHKTGGRYKPTVFIATREDGRELYEYAAPISEDIARTIEEKLPLIEQKFQQTRISKEHSMERWAFMILSNVLLDNWQINNVEDQFLGTAARPLRHGKNYYAAILEAEQGRESFGIYGNQFGEVCIYGNNRVNADLSSTDNYVSGADNEIFRDMASVFLPDLLQILKKHENYCREVYVRSGYADEITFEEFFIWWYHFIYTQATDLMSAANLLTIPEGGNFVYKMQ